MKEAKPIDLDGELTEKQIVEKCQEIFEYSLIQAHPHIDRAAMIQKMFDGDIEAGEFGTLSEVFVPELRRVVKRLLPEMIEFMFPDDGLSSLIPKNPATSYDEVKNTENVIDYVLLKEMRVKLKTIPIAQDSLKFGCGYGIVETKTISVPSDGVFSLLQEGKVVKTGRAVKVAPETRLVPDLRYLNYDQVIPYPDGCTVEECSDVMVVDYYTEQRFRELYASQAAIPEGEDPIYLGDVEEIIKEARDLGISNSVPRLANMYKIAGYTTNSVMTMSAKVAELVSRVNDSSNKFVPTIIPVVKHFMNDRHIWIVNGDRLMKYDEGSYETLRKPVLKLTADLDSNNWWALSDVAAARDIPYAINSYFNAMLDLLSQYLRPTTVYDKRLMDNGLAPVLEPWGQIGVNGKVGDAITTVAPPQAPNGIFGMEQTMSSLLDSNTQVPIGGQASPGLVRGGSFALESLLQTMNAPQELSGMIMDMSFIEPLIMQVLIQLQSLPSETYEMTELKGREYVQTKISLDDIRYTYEVAPDLCQKMRKSINEASLRMAMADRMKGDPWYRQKEVREWELGSRADARALICSDEEYKKNLEIMQAAQSPEKASAPALQGVEERGQ